MKLLTEGTETRVARVATSEVAQPPLAAMQRTTTRDNAGMGDDEALAVAIRASNDDAALEAAIRASVSDGLPVQESQLSEAEPESAPKLHYRVDGTAILYLVGVPLYMYRYL